MLCIDSVIKNRRDTFGTGFDVHYLCMKRWQNHDFWGIISLGAGLFTRLFGLIHVKQMMKKKWGIRELDDE